jgi:hypothetical protein
MMVGWQTEYGSSSSSSSSSGRQPRLPSSAMEFSKLMGVMSLLTDELLLLPASGQFDALHPFGKAHQQP